MISLIKLKSMSDGDAEAYLQKNAYLLLFASRQRVPCGIRAEKMGSVTDLWIGKWRLRIWDSDDCNCVDVWIDINWLRKQ